MAIYVGTDGLRREALDLIENTLGHDITLSGCHLLSNERDIWISPRVAEIVAFPDDGDDDEGRAAPAAASTALYPPRRVP